ncbi:MAG: hypothetical protein IT369_04620 [Candidatus Latescibacteria bacterium]|nr:hypothetical protein [Candidatus Latescibacterota bacterium]
MAVVFGIAVALISLAIGYSTGGGDLNVLVQPALLLIAVGGAVGVLLAVGGARGTAEVFRALVSRTSPRPSARRNLEVLSLMHDIFQLNAREGVDGIEPHVKNPESSALFGAAPVTDPQAVSFIVEHLRLIISHISDKAQVRRHLELDLAARRATAAEAPAILEKVAASLPAWGLVAGLVGMALAAGKTAGPLAWGPCLSAALAGIAPAVLLSHAVVSPLARRMAARAREDLLLREAIAECVIALLYGYDPPGAVEFGRMTLPLSTRPSFDEWKARLQERKE